MSQDSQSESKIQNRVRHSTPSEVHLRGMHSLNACLDERLSTTTCCNLIHPQHPEANVDLANQGRQREATRGIIYSHSVNSPTIRMEPLANARRRSNNRRSIPKSNLFIGTNKYLFTLLVGLLCVVSLVNLAESLLDTQVNICPLSDCLCKWANGKVGAQCERRNLRTLPMQLPSETQVLDMNGNNLIQLLPHIFQERRLTNLQKLYLSDCKLAHIADEAFAQLTNLVELDLSHNNFQQVPTKPLELLRHSLRKLSLAYNQIHVIDPAAFSPLSHLNTLDLTHLMVTTLKPNAFSGLNELRELKLSDNRLSQLPLNAMTSLRENIMIDLYGNPWHCDCELRQTIDWMQKHQILPSINPTCASPPRHKDIRWQNVKPEDFMCPPVILTKPEDIIVGAGSNVTLACSARGSPPLTFVWFQDEKNLTDQGTGSTNQADPPPSTKLLEERRYEIQEELNPQNITTSILFLMNLKMTDTSVFLCWVQNDAGYGLGNFSLIVDDSPPAHLSGYGATGGTINGLGSGLARMFGIEPSGSSNSQVLIVALAFIMLLIATLVTLFVLKQVSKGRSSKSSTKSDLKAQQMNGKLTGSDKFAPMHGKPAQNGRMFGSGYDEGAADDDDHSSDGSTSGSQSSCAKKGNTRVLAVEELDGFIDHLRSGIINMDYHSMSPVIQFNNQESQQTRKKYHKQDQQHQLTHLNHFPSASNASSQQAFYGVQPSNGSNSMATTVSDLSPSSGSASTSFANTNPMMVPQQQQYVPASMATMLRQQTITNCDHPPQHQQFGSQQEMATNATATSYTSDYQSGYSEDPMGQHPMMPPMYGDMDVAAPGNYHYHPANLHTLSRPNSMNAGRQDLVQNVAFQDVVDGRFPSGAQMQQQHYQDSPQGPFTHIL